VGDGGVRRDTMEWRGKGVGTASLKRKFARRLRREFAVGILMTGVALLVSCPANDLLTSIQQKVQEAKGGQTVATPTFSPAPSADGTYTSSSDFTVTISCETSGAAIYYTADGSTPSVSTTVYTAPISLAGNGTTRTIKAIGVKAGMIDSPLATVTYTINYSFATVTTSNISSITTTTATSGGTITSDGGHQVTVRGVCWSTTASPTTANSKTADGSGTGSYTSSLTGLAAGTLYYVRAYAINDAGTAYGNETSQVQFWTVPTSPSAPTVSAVGYAAGSGELSVSWTAVTGATAYDVYCSTTTTPPSSANGPTNVSGTSATISGLTNYTSYYVWIIAKNTSGTSSLSPIATGSPGIHVSGVSISQTTMNLNAGGAADTLTVVFTPTNSTNQNVSWSSSNTAVATVNSSGVVTPGSLLGACTITVKTIDGGETATCTVTTSLAGVVTTVAGSTTAGYTDATGTAARFNNPTGVATDGTNLYVVDNGNNMIRQIVITTGAVTTLAGSTTPGSANGNGTKASFNSPTGVATDGTNLYISDTGNNTIRQIVIATGAVTTLATVNDPLGIATDRTNLYVASGNNHCIDTIVIANSTVTTLVDTSAPNGGVGGTMPPGGFLEPYGVCTDGTNLYFTESNTNTECISRIVINTKAFSTMVSGFTRTEGLATDGTNLYLADHGANMILKIVISSGIVTTEAGSTASGSANGTGAAAGFSGPGDVTLCLSMPALFVADSANNMIREIQ